MWVDSGHWLEASTRPQKGFCMCRFGDAGPYAVGNVYVAHQRRNARERNEWYHRERRTGEPSIVDEHGDYF